jgi:putative hemolysin
MTLELVFLFLLIVANGIFAMSEIAVVSARKARLQQWAEGGDASAQTALALANAPERFLSTVQIGITLVGIFAGAFGGATVAEKLEVILNTIPWLAPYSAALSVTVVVVVITYLSLVIGELTPKRIALTNAERIACTVAPFMNTLSRFTSPIVSFLSWSSELLFRLMGIKETEEPAVTEDEVRILLRQGAEVGVFEATEQQIVERVFRLNDRTAHTLMTPRREVVWFNLTDDWAAIRTKLAQSYYPDFPVADGGLDQVVGMVQAKTLLEQALADAPLDLRALMTPPLFLPESMSVLDILDRFRTTGAEAALVIDEYGGLDGMIHALDIMAGLAGTLDHDHATGDVAIVQREDGSWLIDGQFPIDDFKARFAIKALPEEATIGYQTVGGFVMAFLERIPATGDQFQWNEWQFEIVDMDGNRVDKLLVTFQPPVTTEIS